MIVCEMSKKLQEFRQGSTMHAIESLLQVYEIHVEGCLPLHTLFHYCLNWKINCDDHSSFSSTTAVHIWIISCKLHIISFPVYVYMLLTLCHISSIPVCKMVYLAFSPFVWGNPCGLTNPSILKGRWYPLWPAHWDRRNLQRGLHSHSCHQEPCFPIWSFLPVLWLPTLALRSPTTIKTSCFIVVPTSHCSYLLRLDLAASPVALVGA